MSKIKDFLKEHSQFRIAIQHLGIYDGGFQIRLYNTTYDSGFEPVFIHFIQDNDIDALNVDFETIILTPIINWLDDCERKRKNERFN